MTRIGLSHMAGSLLICVTRRIVHFCCLMRNWLWEPLLAKAIWVQLSYHLVKSSPHPLFFILLKTLLFYGPLYVRTTDLLTGSNQIIGTIGTDAFTCTSEM